METNKKPEEPVKSPEQKYRELISSIKILASRALSENQQEIREKLLRLAKYLEGVRAQKFLCTVLETDRIERLRYNELLRIIGEKYNGTDENLREICKMLDKRKDIDEVLKSYDQKNNKNKEEER